jgi:hypothetical protein
MLNPDEREQLVAALERWSERSPNVPMMGFLESGTIMTPLQMVVEVKENTSDGLAILEMLEHALRREGMAKVVERLLRPPQG